MACLLMKTEAPSHMVPPCAICLSSMALWGSLDGERRVAGSPLVVLTNKTTIPSRSRLNRTVVGPSKAKVHAQRYPALAPKYP